MITEDRALELAEEVLHWQRRWYSDRNQRKSAAEYAEACTIIARIREERDPKNRPASNAGFVTVDR